MKQLSLIFMMCLSLSIYAQNNSTSINMNINMNLDATSGDMPETQQNSDMNINLNIEETQQGHSNTSHTQATTTTTKQPEVIYVSGYSGKIGCTPPVNSERLEDMAKTVKNQTFGDDKVRVTKQIVRSNCITLDQLIILLNEFDWDDGKLEIAKFAYDHVYDLENYYKVYNLFTFSSSGEELDEFIQSKTKFYTLK